jgi:hypothetical protein
MEVIVSVLPLRIVGCDGSPVRAVAWLQPQNKEGSLFVTCGSLLLCVVHSLNIFLQRSNPNKGARVDATSVLLRAPLEDI